MWAEPAEALSLAARSEEPLVPGRAVAVEDSRAGVVMLGVVVGGAESRVTPLELCESCEPVLSARLDRDANEERGDSSVIALSVLP